MLTIKIFLAVLFIIAMATTLSAQTVSSPEAGTAETKQLYDQQRWNDILARIPGTEGQSADADYYRGMALAQLKHWTEARSAFLAGQREAPNDIRFPQELAGVAFQLKNYPAAKRHLRRGLRLSPRDDYANNFLATVYFLEGNLDAALKYWNRIGRPIVSDLTFSSKPRLRPALLDRTFPFSLESEWTIAQLRDTRARADALRIFARYRFDLQALPDGKFDLAFDYFQRNGWDFSHPGRFATLLQVFRGLPYLTIYPDFYDLGEAARNWESLYRWDKEKRRFATSFESPWHDHPEQGYRIYFDGRNENWNVSQTLTPAFVPSAAPTAGFNLEKLETGVEFRFTQNGKLSWTSGVNYALRRYRTIADIPEPSRSFFSDGHSLEYRARLNYQLLEIPEHHFTVGSLVQGAVGKTFINRFGAYTSVRGELHADWLPQARGDDYHFQWRIRSGGISDTIPFDQLYILGLERDNDLWLRGHVGTADGKKGRAPIGPDFFLSNAELDKNIFSNGLFSIKTGPFLDTGKINSDRGYFGSQKWLWDTGLQLKVGVLGLVQVVLVYGKDLRTGNNSFYGTTIQ